MRTIKLDGFIIARKTWNGELEYTWCEADMSALRPEEYATIGPHSIEFVLPEHLSDEAVLDRIVNEGKRRLLARLKRELAQLEAEA